MIRFVKSNHIMNEEDIPEFISNDDLLNGYLNLMKDITAVAIYNVYGTCVEYKSRVKKTKLYNIKTLGFVF